MEFLLHLERAACLKMDPTGKDALISARWMRRNLRALDRRGKVEPDLFAQALKALQPENNGLGFLLERNLESLRVPPGESTEVPAAKT
jgi:hypothetical protein